MAVVFGKSAKAASGKSVVETVFDRPAVVLDETAADAASAPGQVRVITNYRGFTKAGPGRKNALLGQTVVDLAALATIPMSDLPGLIAHLEQLQGELTEALAAEAPEATPEA